jgi:hypothetical protein
MESVLCTLNCLRNITVTALAVFSHHIGASMLLPKVKEKQIDIHRLDDSKNESLPINHMKTTTFCLMPEFVTCMYCAQTKRCTHVIYYYEFCPHPCLISFISFLHLCLTYVNWWQLPKLPLRCRVM